MDTTSPPHLLFLSSPKHDAHSAPGKSELTWTQPTFYICYTWTWRTFCICHVWAHMDTTNLLHLLYLRSPGHDWPFCISCVRVDWDASCVLYLLRLNLRMLTATSGQNLLVSHLGFFKHTVPSASNMSESSWRQPYLLRMSRTSEITLTQQTFSVCHIWVYLDAAYLPCWLYLNSPWHTLPSASVTSELTWMQSTICVFLHLTVPAGALLLTWLR